MPPRRIGNTLAYENDDVNIISSFQEKGYRTVPIFYVNGKAVPSEQAKQAKPNQTLLSFLRDVMLLTGSKLGCSEGGCGACTVLLSRVDPSSKKLIHSSVNACLTPVLATDSCHITTIEGIGTIQNLHPIQKAMVEMHGSQCGFCTPGIIVALYGLFANNSKQEYIEEHLDGNLCRCTGYRPIWDAARTLTTTDDIEDATVYGPCGTACSECPERDTCEMECNINDKKQQKESTKNTTCSNHESSNGACSDAEDDMCCSTSKDKIKQFSSIKKDDSWLKIPEKMFPNELLQATETKPLLVVDPTYYKAGTWIQPTSFESLLQILHQFKGDCKIVVGNTEVGIETKFKHSVFSRLIYPSHSISSLYGFEIKENSIQIGSCTSLSTIQHKCETMLAHSDTRISRTMKPIHDMLRWFASTQIRNVACLGGNLATASPISDMNPVLAAMGATLTLSSWCDENQSVQRRQVKVSEFFTRYRVVDLQPDELIETINIPLVKATFEYVIPFKQARRREDDISIVTSCMRVRIEEYEQKYLVSDIALAFGGMAPKTILATNTADSLMMQEFHQRIVFEQSQQILQQELTLPENVPGGQAEYRMALASSFFFQFFLHVTTRLNEDIASFNNKNETKLSLIAPIDSKEESALKTFVSDEKPTFHGIQIYQTSKCAAKGLEESHLPKQKITDENIKVVGKNAHHASAPLHCTGQAIYADDIPLPPKTLQATLILAKQCNVEFVSFETEDALKTPGVVAIITSKDIQQLGGDNGMGPIVHDEHLFLPEGEIIPFVGQVLGICVGETLESSEAGARAVQIKYGQLSCEQPTIVSIEDAIEHKSFYDFARHKLERGNIHSAFGNSDDSIIEVEGSFRCGGQDHFYLETNSSLVIPNETGLEVYASTQNPTETQKYCATTTNTPASKVIVKMKRMGGGFGGKETRSTFVSCAASVAAKLLNLPVRLTLSRCEDMSITGGRHAFLAKYRASARMDSGSVKLLGLDVKLYSNGGCTFDLSGPVMDRAIFHVDGSYFWPHFRAIGVPCKTVQPPHTAFRGFGGPQGMAVCEYVITHLSTACNISIESLRKQNLYQVGDLTPFGMQIGDGPWNVPTMWQELEAKLNIAEKRRNIRKFNDANRWKKRGAALIPTKFGIAFTAKFMNQGGALVHLYTDGTVLVTHGGTEMGQGLHTKVCQIAAQAFSIPVEDVFVNDTSTDKVANTIASAASMSTDLYGMATLDACRQILKRIEPIQKRLGVKSSLAEVAKEAFFNRIDLSAHGFFAVDNDRCGFDWNKTKPEDIGPDVPENSWKGHPFNYFTQGVAYSEVEIDILTGNHKTLESHVLVDVGASINPLIDIGQIEGAFIQGMGWSTLEEVVYADKEHSWIRPSGRVFTSGPGTYKIPAFNDVPELFHVELLKNAKNPFAVHSSKAVGEPPFFLGTSVFYAIKDALIATKVPSEKNYELRLPASSERIRMASKDIISETIVKNTTDYEKFQVKGSF